MRHRLSLLVFTACLLPMAAFAELEIGKPAPPFDLQGSDGEQYTLERFVGKQGVVLAWFPKAFTPGWTKELEALRDSADAIAAYDAAVFMVSLDEPEKNKAFAESLGTTQVLLSDSIGTSAEAYGVASQGSSYARRWTIYIDDKGIVREIDKQVNVGSAGQDIARKLLELGFKKRQ